MGMCRFREKQRGVKTQWRGKNTIKPFPKNGFAPPTHDTSPPPLLTPCHSPEREQAQTRQIPLSEASKIGFGRGHFIVRSPPPPQNRTIRFAPPLRIPTYSLNASLSFGKKHFTSLISASSHPLPQAQRPNLKLGHDVEPALKAAWIENARTSHRAFRALRAQSHEKVRKESHPPFWPRVATESEKSQKRAKKESKRPRFDSFLTLFGLYGSETAKCP